jgi:DNA-directed RNA polymerase sigma subunit (sigma70/sigma32)
MNNTRATRRLQKEIKEQEKYLTQALSYLTPREEKVLRLFYGIEEEQKSTTEIGEYFHLINASIYYIKKKAEGRLRTALISVELGESFAECRQRFRK